MTAPAIDAIEIGHYLELLFPDPPADAWLVVSWPDGSRQLLSKWFRSPQTDQAVQFLARQARRTNMYVGLGLRHPDCPADEHSRGTSEEVFAIGGLWIEFDHSKGVHTSRYLPTPDELLTFIKALPFTFSLLVDSSGGYHGYLLFKELWLLDTPEDQQAATLLLRRFQRTMQARATERGWKVDTTSDLARVLRPAGTLNHKTGTPRGVNLLHEDAVRYNPSDLVDAPWLATIEDTFTPPSRNGSFALTQFPPIVDGCAWLRHCRDDAATLSEPEWYSMLGIVGRTVEGETIAHEWSSPYPRYTKEETTRKLSHALADAGPSTCSSIRYDRGGESYCRECQHWNGIKSPVVLGMDRRRRVSDSSFSPSDLSSQFVRNGSDRGDPHKTSSKRISSLSSLSSPNEWPDISPEAFHGVAGTIIKTLSPHSEADPVALLLQLLTYFGAVLGRRAYYQVEATRHYAHLFTCLVGPTGKGRKGTAYDHIAFYMRSIDTSWTLTNISGGCGSGEGLIYAVRDPVSQREAIREKKHVVGYQDVETDQGVIDKRLLVYESEFAGVLKVVQREGNLLSVILRQAWDNGNLRNTVKSSPLRATEAHISVIGHITIDELQRYLTETEMGNGFANRILWPLVRRAQILPDGGAMQTVDVQPLVTSLREAFTKAKAIEQMQRDDEAAAIWHAVYTPLSEGKPGLVGALLARGEAQVLRLSMIYALLDGSATITRVHLNAALAVWQYCEASALYIFGTASGDATADTLLTALEAVHPEGLARKVILTETFQGHLRADELDRVMNLLLTHHRITVDEVPREKGKGRPKQILKYLPSELSELSEFNHPTYLSISNDAVKSMQLSSQHLRTNCELSSDDALSREEFDA